MDGEEEEESQEMTFPYAFESNFELGTNAEWTSETDTESKLNVRHYTDLAKTPLADFVPFSGAYCAHIDLSLGTADAYLQADTAFDTALAGTIFMRLYLWAGNLTMATSDRFTIFALQSAAGTDEAAISIVNNAGTMQVVFAELGTTTLGANTRASDLIQQRWHCLEMGSVIDAGGGNDGTITAYMDGYQIGAAITGLDQAAIIHTRLGAIGIDAGTTRGHLLFDSIVADDTRIAGLRDRGSTVRRATKSMHLALGHGALHHAALYGSAEGDTLTLWDTHTADLTDPGRIVYGPVQHTGVQDTPRIFDSPLFFSRGLYAQMTGVSPQAQVLLCEASDMTYGDVRLLGNR